MFPYPSGAGLHVGLPLGYTAIDIISRYKRMQGFNVLHPMEWDAFGLPAEQYAIETGTHPTVTTRNIERFSAQANAGYTKDPKIMLPIQINGNTRGIIEVEEATIEDDAFRLAAEDKKLSKYLVGATIKNTIYVPKRILNIILQPVKVGR